MLTYVEHGTEFVNQYGDIQENAYSSMESTFGRFSDIVKKNENTVLFEFFHNRINSLESNVQGIGYGYADEISWMIEELLKFFKKKK